MVRRTKQQSLETRSAIVAAARAMFYHNGVTNTSLEQIAEAAGVTRGAIYWHFSDKAELFYAMRDEVKLPIVDRSQQFLATDAIDDPLERVARCIDALVSDLAHCETTRQTLWIMTFQCEYVGDFARDLDRTHHMHDDFRAKLVACYREARARGLLRADLTPPRAALETTAFVAGLIRLWILDEKGTLVRRTSRQLIADHVRCKRAGPVPAPATRRQSRRSDVRKVSTA